MGASGGRVRFGFNASHGAANAAPVSFALIGTVCR